MKNAWETEEKVFSYMEQHHMLSPGERVVAGISGGADSLCLLFVLLEWQKRRPFSLAAVHVNHGIRKEAGEDARYVEALCRERGIPFYMTETDVEAKAAAEKCSPEEAGRNARYEAFQKAAEDFGAQKIAVAHNLNDRSETMLFHLFRGTGLRGLGSIRPVRDNIIRPLLCLERQEIEAYLKTRGISWRQDITNEGDDYTRNRIRHHILPYAQREIAAGCQVHMAETAQMLAETEEYLEQQTAEAAKRCAVCPGEALSEGIKLDVEAFLKEHPVLQKRILFSVINTLTASARDISRVHIQALLSLFEKEGNRRVDLPCGIRGRREYGRVVLELRAGKEKKDSPKGRGEEEKRSLWKEVEVTKSDLGQEEELLVPLEEGGWLAFSVFPRDIQEDFPEKECTKWFDCDKIEKSLVVRTRKTGDYLTIADGKGGQMHKSVKDYMIAAKIPGQLRDRIPLVAEGEHVLWIVGRRISENYKISGNTKRILQVQLKGSRENDKTEEKNGRES